MKSMLLAAALLSASALAAAEPFVLKVEDGKMSIGKCKNGYGTMTVVDGGLLMDHDKIPGQEYNIIDVKPADVTTPGAAVEADFDLKVVRFADGKPGAFHANIALLKSTGDKCWNCLMRIDRDKLYTYAGNWKYPADFSPMERHTYKMTLDPADGTARIFVDGVERISGKTRFSKPAEFIWFGDGTKRDSAGAVILYSAEIR